MSHPSLFAAAPEILPFSIHVAPDRDDPLCDLLFNQSPLGVGVVEWLGDDIRYLAVNPSTAARLGRSAEEVRGRRASELGVPSGALTALSRLAASALKQGTPTRMEWEAQTVRGLQWFRTTVSPLPTPAGRPPRLAYFTEELTRLRELEQRLGGPQGSKSLATDVEQPLADALGALDMVGDEVATLAAIHPELELQDASDGLRQATQHTRRAHKNLRQLLWG